MKSAQKGFSSIVILILIAAGIGIGVWGVQYANFGLAPKASENMTTSSAPIQNDKKKPDIYYMAPKPIMAGAVNTFVARAKDKSGISRVDILIAGGPKCRALEIYGKPNYFSCDMISKGTGIKRVTVYARDNSANFAQRTYSVSSKATPKPSSTVTPKATGETRVVCAQDAKMCPDGSYVGRTGPNCEFSTCP